MTTSSYAERANLSRLHQVHPDWSHQQLATSLGRSREWVKKWRKRLREEGAAGLPLAQVLQGHSRARKHPPAQTPAHIVERILRIRDEPPQGLRRVPGPEAIAYYLGQQAEQETEPLPVASCRTISRILKAQGGIAQRLPRVTQPVERPVPLSSWQLDAERHQHGACRSLRQAATRRRNAQCPGCRDLHSAGGARAGRFHRPDRLRVACSGAADPWQAQASHLGSRPALGG